MRYRGQQQSHAHRYLTRVATGGTTSDTGQSRIAHRLCRDLLIDRRHVAFLPVFGLVFF